MNRRLIPLFFVGCLALLLTLWSAPAVAQYQPTMPDAVTSGSVSDGLSAAGSSAVLSGSGLGFGGALAVGDGEIFVGSAPIGWPRGDEPAGEVYQYVLGADGTWQEAARLTASDAMTGDDFGRSLVTDGSRLVVGAPGNAAAYLFERSEDGTWVETGKLVPSTLAGDAEFGGAYARAGSRTQNIALVGDHVAVTAYDPSTNTGSVHIFAPGASGWVETDIVRSDDASDSDGFGFTVAGHMDMLAVGAPAADNRTGAIYAYTLDQSGTASQAARLTLDGVEGPTGLGSSMEFHMHHLVAGAPLTSRSGLVVAYDGHADWAEMARVGPPEQTDQTTTPVTGFGASVAISRADVLVGARRGLVFASPFSLDPSFQRITAPDDRRGPAFGTGLAIGGDVAVIGSPGADYEAGLATVYERSAASGRWIESAILESEVGHFSAVTGEEVVCEDGKAGEFSCDNVNLVSFLPISDLSSSRGVGMTDVWGWTDPETGKEWVLAGRTEGVAFVDISDPANPVYVGELPKTADTPGSGWRDVKVYANHAYVVADGARHHGVQVFDMTQLRDVDPSDMPVTFRQTNWYGGTASTHNFVVNEESGFGYAVGNRSGGDTCGGQLHMIDLSDPGNPSFAGCYSHPDAGGTHDSQCVMYRGPDADYQGREVCLNSNGGSFVIADVTDKSDPQTIIKTDYPNLAYTHQGWLTEDHRYFYMNDELDEMNALVTGTRTLIWDVQDLDDPALVGEYTHEAPASDHNLYIKGNLMYQANYQAGIQILDISDRLNPVLVGEFDTVPFGEDEAGFGGAWSTYPWFESGVLPVTSRGEGLFIIRKKEQDI